MKIRLYKERREIKRENGQVYLVRWYIFQNKHFGLMLHKILLSDQPCVHDHPWNFISLILKGGYVEHTEIARTTASTDEELIKLYGYDSYMRNFVKKTSKIYHPGQILFRKAEHRHTLEIHQTCWSLVLKFKAKRRWGFLTKDGWVHWKAFSETNCDN